MKGLLTVTLAAAMLASSAARAQSGPHPDSTAEAGVKTAVPTKETQPAQKISGGLYDPKSGCAALPVDAVSADAVAWSGPCDHGLVSGSGTLTLSSQGKLLESLTGEFDKGALRDGHVSIKWADGSIYAGNAVAGHMDGAGELTTAAGDRFEGQWKSGHLNGAGSAVWANGDRYEGDWRDGKAAGHGVQTWADGRKYDGEWLNDQPNGRGIVTRKDGSRFDAEFEDGQLKSSVQLAVTTQSESALVRADAQAPAKTDQTTDIAANTKDTQSKSSGPSSAVQSPAIAGIAGRKFTAIDGSSLTMTANDDGLVREIVAPDGTAKKNGFEFLSDRLGSVSDGEDADNVVGVFRLTNKGIVTEYSDGRTETLYPNTEGGVSMQLSAPNGAAYCMAWYPEGHHFSVNDRKAALAQYANHLGLDAPHSKAPKQAPKPSCGSPAVFNVGSESVLPAPRRADTPAVSLPRATTRLASARDSKHARVASAMPASFVAPLPADPATPVEVRTSTVHAIDSAVPSITQGGTTVASLPPATKSASTCLSVESDGQHWAFRNHCGYDVQFAYCLKTAGDPLASCDKGAITGSVSPNGSTALVADRSLSETNADHDFRWVACGGGAGEVVVHLDQSDPPAGRCVRPDAS